MARLAELYNAQKPELDAMVAKMGKTPEDLFIPRVFVVDRDGSAYTGTSWTQGIPAMLPPSDVLFMAEQPVTAGAAFLTMRVRWDVVADMCADTCWEVQSAFTPVRVLTVGWPTLDQIHKLTELALDVQVRRINP